MDTRWYKFETITWNRKFPSRVPDCELIELDDHNDQFGDQFRTEESNLNPGIKSESELGQT